MHIIPVWYAYKQCTFCTLVDTTVYDFINFPLILNAYLLFVFRAELFQVLPYISEDEISEIVRCVH